MYKLIILTAVLISINFVSCSNKKETPTSIAKKWCELSHKVDLADGEAKETAKEAVKKYEEDMEAKYGKDETFMNQIEDEVEKCEDASEGKE